MRLDKEALYGHGIRFSHRTVVGCGREEDVGYAFQAELLINLDVISQFKSVCLRQIHI